MNSFRKRPFLSQSNTQLYWAILLLAVAVVLPTVCLLWFMNQAVRNERLAIRQKLIDMYSGRAEKLFAQYSDNFTSTGKKLLSDSETLSPDKLFESIVNSKESLWQAVIVYNKNGQLIFPLPAAQLSLEEDTPVFPKAWKLEFVDKDFSAAADAYSEAAGSGDDTNWANALTGKIRCLQKAGKITDAIDTCRQLAWPQQKKEKIDRLIAGARLMLLNLYKQNSPQEFSAACEKILDNRFTDLSLDSQNRLFLLRQTITIIGALDSQQLVDKIKITQKTLDAESALLDAAQLFPDTASFKGWPDSALARLPVKEKLYGVHFTDAGKSILALVSGEKMSQFWRQAAADMNDQTIFCRLFDDTGRPIDSLAIMPAGESSLSDRTLFSQPLGKNFPGFKSEFYFMSNTFTEAAHRQQIIYLWTFTLVIALTILFAALVARLFLRQAKLNQLKNNFIATVTHELKTPLSSMRILTDSLLGDVVKDSQQSKEYLTLISKENERLSRLIDNFLTFSRMERNKQAFDLKPENPADIAYAAADTIHTKFNNGSSKFVLTLGQNLPLVSADKDAIVTVLVNLLDNAYKYSYNNKQIELIVAAENGGVCFSVKDNGVGMNRRVIKKIFNKFYQADATLSRKTGGCGLGLSIAKFIVDAHKGTIDVQSEPGKGSTFTVRLKAV